MYNVTKLVLKNLLKSSQCGFSFKCFKQLSSTTQYMYNVTKLVLKNLLKSSQCGFSFKCFKQLCSTTQYMYNVPKLVLKNLLKSSQCGFSFKCYCPYVILMQTKEDHSFILIFVRAQLTHFLRMDRLWSEQNVALSVARFGEKSTLQSLAQISQ